jgi:uncharacterized protein YkwD
MRHLRLPRTRRRSAPALERLDARCVPATSLTPGGVTAAMVGNILVVAGTEANDQIVLSVQSQVPTVSWRRFRGLAALQAAAPQVVVQGVGAFPMNQIGQVWIAGGGGDDAIAINDGGRPVPLAVINAGAGNDVVLGGSGFEAILGGDGNDIILSRGGHDLIDGGTGTNWINGQVNTVLPPSEADSPPIQPVASPPSSPGAPTLTPIRAPQPGDPDLGAWATQIIELTNAQRRNNGLPELAVNDRLNKMAQIQAEQMASLDKMQHELPEAAYPDLRSRASAAGYNFSWLGENIAFNYPDPAGVVQGWMLSKGHRENILNTDYTEIGVAVALNADGRPYFAQVFGHPA